MTLSAADLVTTPSEREAFLCHVHTMMKSQAETSYQELQLSNEGFLPVLQEVQETVATFQQSQEHTLALDELYRSSMSEFAKHYSRVLNAQFFHGELTRTVKLLSPIEAPDYSGSAILSQLGESNTKIKPLQQNLSQEAEKLKALIDTAYTKVQEAEEAFQKYQTVPSLSYLKPSLTIKKMGAIECCSKLRQHVHQIGSSIPEAVTGPSDDIEAVLVASVVEKIRERYFSYLGSSTISFADSALFDWSCFLEEISSFDVQQQVLEGSPPMPPARESSPLPPATQRRSVDNKGSPDYSASGSPHETHCTPVPGNLQPLTVIQGADAEGLFTEAP